MTRRSSSRIVLDKLLSLRSFIGKPLPQATVCILNLIKTISNRKATLTVNKVNENLSELQLDIGDKENIDLMAYTAYLSVFSPNAGKYGTE